MREKRRLAVIAAAVIGISLAAFDELAPRHAVPPLAEPGNALSDVMPSNGEAVLSETPEYRPGAVGFYARPAAEGTYPGVVMIHEWWGLNDHIKDMASKLAAEGYQVLAVDLFGRVAATPEEARALTQAVIPEKAVENLRAAAAFLRARGAAKVASLGWCFGGGQSLRLALSGEPLDATVIYYGQLVTDREALKAINWPVLGIFGSEDQSIKPETVREFDGALDALGVDNEVYVYPGVGHAFANPSNPNHAPAAALDAWMKTVDFLASRLKGE